MQTFHFNIGGQPNQPNQPQELTKEQNNYLFNSIILDIYNNWNSINDLMFQYINKLLKKVNQWDKEWLTFIQNNNIKLEQFEDKEKFLDTYWKKN